jgi:hypothetical protein
MMLSSLIPNGSTVVAPLGKAMGTYVAPANAALASNIAPTRALPPIQNFRMVLPTVE